ncbi:MAG TPA: 30S ribosomal protein S20 [Verrucomicrobiae bacterium]|nr:30S ribosomal protein S20 [Verrucomicrobiae bacterium]
MPNTKSAERRMRNSSRKQVQNRSINTRLHTLEKKFAELLGAGKKEDAAKALQGVVSALDKAAKTGTVPKARASRKKSRLTLQFNRASQPAAAAAK